MAVVAVLCMVRPLEAYISLMYSTFSSWFCFHLQ